MKDRRVNRKLMVKHPQIIVLLFVSNTIILAGNLAFYKPKPDLLRFHPIVRPAIVFAGNHKIVKKSKKIRNYPARFPTNKIS